jgi:hypothetical protein
VEPGIVAGGEPGKRSIIEAVYYSYERQFIGNMENTGDKISPELLRELRMLAHDLSNALETIVQATYLISQAGPPENSRRWVEMIDQASHDAVKINNKLREIMRAHS